MKKVNLIRIIIVSLIMLNPMFLFSLESTFELKLDKDKTSATVYKSVLFGDKNIYHFNSSAGKQISIAISSLENHAVFELVYKKNDTWATVDGVKEVKKWSGELPLSESNRYGINVEGNMENASYELFVKILDAAD